MKTLTIKVLTLLICALLATGCGEDFPLDRLIGRWEIIRIKHKYLIPFFRPLIEAQAGDITLTEVKWHYLFDEDGTWSSVIAFRGNRFGYLTVKNVEETITLRGNYMIEGSIITLEITNTYASSDTDFIKLSFITPYLILPRKGHFDRIIHFENFTIRRA